MLLQAAEIRVEIRARDISRPLGRVVGRLSSVSTSLIWRLLGPARVSFTGVSFTVVSCDEVVDSSSTDATVVSSLGRWLVDGRLGLWLVDGWLGDGWQGDGMSNVMHPGMSNEGKKSFTN